jgi:transcriptional regulator with XRE-family HTH domain
MEDLGMVIRKRRLELKLKVYELAKLVEVDPVYISQIEIHNKLPAPALFERIRKVLKLDEQVKNLYLHKKIPDIFTNADPDNLSFSALKNLYLQKVKQLREKELTKELQELEDSYKDLTTNFSKFTKLIK